MMVMDDFPKLERQVERLRSEKERAEGAKEEILRRLKENFGCKNLQAAETKLEEMRAQLQAIFHKYNRYRKKFDKRWRKVLKSG